MNAILPAEGLFGPGVAVVLRPVGPDAPPLAPCEEAAVARAVPSRRLEFASGRHCARLALERLGLPPAPIPAGDARQPCWPPGIVGSISHCRSFCIAAAARRDGGHVSIGVDVEEADELDAGLVATICTPAERSRLAGLGLPPLRAAKMLFSIKESVFKCQFPLTRALLEFTDLEIRLDPARHAFDAVLLREAGPFRAGETVSGRVRLAAGHVLSSAWIGGPARSVQ